MSRPSSSLTRWLKLALACFALAAFAPAQAAAGGAAPVEPVAQVEGGPARPGAVRTAVRAGRYLPPAGLGRRVAQLRAPAGLGGAPRGVRDRLFILHRALLR